MTPGWSKAKGSVARAAFKLGHKLGHFRRNGDRRTARCASCHCHVDLFRRNGRWKTSLRSARCDQIRAAKLRTRSKRKADR